MLMSPLGVDVTLKVRMVIVGGAEAEDSSDFWPSSTSDVGLQAPDGQRI